MSIADFSQTELIDTEQYEMLVEAGDSEAKEMLTELLDLFTSESGDNIKELAEKVASGDNERSIRISHAIAGSAGNLGLQRLSVVARDLENQFNVYTQEERNQVAQNVTDLYEKSIKTYQTKIDLL